MHWPVHELHQLSQLIVEIGDCFMVRRTLDRLEAGELTLQEAIVLLRPDPTASRMFSQSAFLGSMAGALCTFVQNMRMTAYGRKQTLRLSLNGYV